MEEDQSGNIGKNSNALFELGKQLVYHLNPHKQLLDLIQECIKYGIFINDKEKFDAAINLCEQGINQYPKYSYEFLSKLSYIFLNLKIDYNKSLFYNELAIVTISGLTEDLKKTFILPSFCEVISSMLFDQYSIHLEMKNYEKALVAINNAILPGISIIPLLIEKIKLLIELNKYGQAAPIVNACIAELKPLDKTFSVDREFIELYSLRKKINEFYKDFDEIKKDNEKIIQYGGSI